MRYSELTEAPIDDITVHDHKGSTAFSKGDSKLIRSPKAKERIVRGFSRTPFRFEIHFVEHEAFDANNDFDNTKVDSFSREHGAGIHDVYQFHDLHFAGKPGVITVVMLGNLAPVDKIPMTPWTLAHKIGHSFQDDVYYTTGWKGPIGEKVQQINSLINRLDSPDNTSTIFNTHPSVANKLTMKSARSGNLLNGFEIFAEILAQYLIRGKVSIPEHPETENELNKVLEDLFQSVVGKVLVEL